LAKKTEDSSIVDTGRPCTNGESRENEYSCGKSTIIVNIVYA